MELSTTKQLQRNQQFLFLLAEMVLYKNMKNPFMVDLGIIIALLIFFLM